MSDTEICSRCSAANVRAATPGTPSMPLPSTVMSACPGALESAFTGTSSAVSRSETSVPGALGSPKGRTKSGTLRPMIGISARGCSTLAP
jgi:hypothetical protein